MARLIDADKIYDAIERRYRVSSGIEHRCERDFLDLICETDTVDAVEVVRCRDCRHRECYDALLYCGHTRGLAGSVAPNNFCSYGERKEGDD